MSRIVINDWLAWGNLLKTWTTGRGYCRDSQMYARPSTLNEARAQLAKSGAGSIPEWVIDFELIDWCERKLLIQLPSSRTISTAETLLDAGKPYPLPAFYRNITGELPAFDDPSARLNFHAMRIGEHTVDVFG
jgi:hypothetical protein